MIIAHEFGWAAVSDRPMDYEDFQRARQLVAELRVGAKVREARAAEDARFRASTAALKRSS